MQVLRRFMNLSMLVWLQFAASCAPTTALGQSNSCLTAVPDGTIFLGSLRRLYADPTIDSVKWKSAGFPFATGSAISLVTDNRICSAAVKAFNDASKLTGTPDAVSQVYVAKIGSTGYVVMTPQENPPGEWHTGYWFTTKWVLKQQLGM